MTIGDVLAVVAALVLGVGSWAALLVAAQFLFPKRVAEIAERIERAPGRCAMRGVGMLTLAVVAFSFLSHAIVGPGWLLVFLMGGMLLAASALGSAGVVRIMAVRAAQNNDPAPAHLTRAALLYTLAGLFPFCGWMVALPAALLVSLGAALTGSVSARQTSTGIVAPESVA